MPRSPFGLLTSLRRMQPLLRVIETGADDTALAPFMTEHAIVFTDLSGFSAHPNLIEALRRVLSFERALATVFYVHGGTLIKVMGDSTLLLFPTVRQAVACIEALRALLPDNQFCVGIGAGNVVVCQHWGGRLDVFGCEISLASRLCEDVASGWQVLVSESAYGHLTTHQRARCVEGQAGTVRYWELRERA